jgi:hypothetical protein
MVFFTLALGVDLTDVLRDTTAPTAFGRRILVDRVGLLVLTTGITASKSATRVFDIAS